MTILILHLKLIQERTIEVYHKSKLVPGIEMQFSNGPGRLISRILPILWEEQNGAMEFRKKEIALRHKATTEKISSDNLL